MELRTGPRVGVSREQKCHCSQCHSSQCHSSQWHLSGNNGCSTNAVWCQIPVDHLRRRRCATCKSDVRVTNLYNLHGREKSRAPRRTYTFSGDAHMDQVVHRCPDCATQPSQLTWNSNSNNKSDRMPFSKPKIC